VIISGSLWRKAIATTAAVGAFVAAYDVTILDSKYATWAGAQRELTAAPSPGAHLGFQATAYCKGIMTSAGTPVQAGVAAADPAVLPVGSVIQIDSVARYGGIYTVLDTGPSVQGRLIDLYMWSCNEALAFGRQAIGLTVLRLGWNPIATTPGLLDRLFRGPERPGRSPLPSRPLPQVPGNN